MNDYDVIVVGAGMVGSAAACLFGAGGARVALLESAPPGRPIDKQTIDLRVSAISAASQTLLSRLGAWQRIEADVRCPYREMKVWDAAVPPASDAVLHFDSAEIGAADLGHIVENRRIVAALYECVTELAEVDLYTPATAQALSADLRNASVRIDAGRTLTARLVIGADGAASPTRQFAGIETRGHGYDQRAVVTHVSTERPHGGIAYQRFLPSGPIALLPLYDGRSSIVWSTNPRQAEQLLALDQVPFASAVTQASDGVLGEVLGSDARASFPLALQFALDYVRPRLALIGDAAHTVHPLAGQGVNLGFADALALHDALGALPDPGALSGLRRYERGAKSRNTLMMTALDGLHRLFTTSSPLVARLRSAGLGLVNRSGPVKQALIRRALGY